MKSLSDLVRAGGVFALFGSDRALKLAGRSVKQFLEDRDSSRTLGSYTILELLEILGLTRNAAKEIESATLPHRAVIAHPSGPLIEVVVTPVARRHFTLSITSPRSDDARHEAGEADSEILKNSTLAVLSQAIAHDVNNSLGVILGFASLSVDEVRRVAAMLPPGPAANQLNAIATQLATVVSSSEAAVGTIAHLVALVDTDSSAPRR